MTDLAPRPRSSTELVDAAFQIYRRQPTQFIVATALVYVPWLVIRLALGVGIRTGMPEVRDLVIIAVGTLLTYVIVGGVVTRLANDAYLDARISVADALLQVGRQFPVLIVAALIRLVFFFLGMLAFGIGLFYPLARYFAVIQTIVVERRGPIASLSRSSTLSQGLKWHILGTLFLLFIINAAISLGAGFMLSVLGSRVIEQVLATVTSIIVYPLYGIGETLLYLDARIRNEGYDVELLAATPAHAGQSAGVSI